MLYIRTQDRMSLVPFDKPIIIMKNSKADYDSLYTKYCENIKINVPPYDKDYYTTKEAERDAKNELKNYDRHDLKIFFEDTKSDIMLGTYATKERALEVLDEIESYLYTSKDNVCEMPKE